MHNQTVTGKLNTLIMLLLLTALFILPSTSQRAPISPPLSTQTAMSAVCPNAKTNTTSTTRVCPYQTGGFELFDNTMALPTFAYTLSEKIYFLFLLGLLTASHQRRIERPPKLFSL